MLRTFPQLVNRYRFEPMPILTRAAFAKLAGTSAPNITQLIRRKKLISEKGPAGYISTTRKLNAAYLKKHGIKPQKAKRGKRHENDEALAIRKARADAVRSEEQGQLIAQKRAALLGLLIERTQMERMFAAFGAEIKVRFLDLGRRLAPRVAAVIQAGGGPQAAEELIDAEIADALKHAKEAALRAGLGSLGN
jgi:hypothetical protein